MSELTGTPPRVRKSGLLRLRSTQFRANPFQVTRKILAWKLLSSVRTGKLAQTAHAHMKAARTIRRSSAARHRPHLRAARNQGPLRFRLTAYRNCNCRHLDYVIRARNRRNPSAHAFARPAHRHW